MTRVVVIGAGLAGLSAALRLAQSGVRVTLATKGPGGLQLSQGTIDVLGYSPDRVERPLEALDGLPEDHPYASVGADRVAEAVSWLADELGPELLVGDPAVNMHLPTAVGAIRPTALVQPSMVAGDVVGGRSYAVVGVRQLKDFPADLIAGNLARSTAPDGGAISATSAWIDLPARRGEHDPSPLTYARAMDDEVFASSFARAVEKVAGKADAVALPAVLGVKRLGVYRQIADILGREVFEIPLPPPSVPGLRLYYALLAKVRDAGVRFIQGAKITGYTGGDGRIESVTLDAAGAPRPLKADAFVFAPGGFESGAIHVDSYGTITEPVFGLPLTQTNALDLITPTWWGPHPLFEVGVRVDDAGRPTDGGAVVYDNFYVAGGIIAGSERYREKSGEGVAVATAVRAANHITGGAR